MKKRTHFFYFYKYLMLALSYYCHFCTFAHSLGRNSSARIVTCFQSHCRAMRAPTASPFLSITFPPGRRNWSTSSTPVGLLHIGHQPARARISLIAFGEKNRKSGLMICSFRRIPTPVVLAPCSHSAPTPASKRISGAKNAYWELVPSLMYGG